MKWRWILGYIVKLIIIVIEKSIQQHPASRCFRWIRAVESEFFFFFLEIVHNAVLWIEWIVGTTAADLGLYVDWFALSKQYKKRLWLAVKTK